MVCQPITRQLCRTLTERVQRTKNKRKCTDWRTGKLHWLTTAGWAHTQRPHHHDSCHDVTAHGVGKGWTSHSTFTLQQLHGSVKHALIKQNASQTNFDLRKKNLPCLRTVRRACPTVTTLFTYDRIKTHKVPIFGCSDVPINSTGAGQVIFNR